MYAEITATFRYGRDDLDVLGINFKKDLYTVGFYDKFTAVQVYRLSLQFFNLQFNLSLQLFSTEIQILNFAVDC